MQLGTVRYIQLLKDGSPPQEIAFYVSNFKELFSEVMNTIDLKLSECYWAIIAELMGQSQSFSAFFVKLRFWHILHRHFEIFLPSQAFQQAIIFVILECGLKPSNVKFVKEEILKLIDVVMDVFIKTTEKEPISYCFWSMYFYTQKYEGSCDHLLSLFMSH